jgi:hypothetical protein
MASSLSQNCSPLPLSAAAAAEALGGWGELLAGCSLIFVHAPSSNWQQLFGGEQPLLDKADQRIRWAGGQAHEGGKLEGRLAAQPSS